MKDTRILRRWKSATLKLVRNAAFPHKRPKRLKRTEEWALRQMVYAAQAGRLEMRYEDGALVYLSAGPMASTLRTARPPRPGAAPPVLKVVVRSQEEYEHAAQVLEDQRAAR